MIRKYVANKANNFAIEKKEKCINIKRKEKKTQKERKRKQKFALHYIHEISWL